MELMLTENKTMVITDLCMSSADADDGKIIKPNQGREVTLSVSDIRCTKRIDKNDEKIKSERLKSTCTSLPL